jgi:hypothetical protein
VVSIDLILRSLLNIYAELIERSVVRRTWKVSLNEASIVGCRLCPKLLKDWSIIFWLVTTLSTRITLEDIVIRLKNLITRMIYLQKDLRRKQRWKIPLTPADYARNRGL